MVYSKNYKFPSDEELNVQEIGMSLPAFRAVSLLMGKFCDFESKEFMLCRVEQLDPRKCLKEGRDVTACGLRFMQKMKKHCMKEVENQAICLEYSARDYPPFKCRKTEELMNQCVFETTGVKRPHLGYFSMPRIHHTERPRVVNPIEARRFEKPTGFESAPEEIKNMKYPHL